MTAAHVAIDLGAGSGRVVLGTLRDDRLDLEVLHRFANRPHRIAGHDRWNVRELCAGIATGLGKLRGRAVESIGVDTWGVDYGLIDAAGGLVEDPICYRDPRTDGVVDAVTSQISRAELFAATGLQVQQFNTLFQLWAHVRSGVWPATAAGLLMMPDIFHGWLCGSRMGEFTNATTTQCLRVGAAVWHDELMVRLGLPIEVMPELVTPGTELGTLLPERRRELGLGPVRVIAPPTHDTASAVVGTPLRAGWAYISSGTWSLVGIETQAPLLAADVAAQNLTNEGGAFGTNRLLVNVMGLWILESCRGVWEREGVGLSHDELVTAASAAPALRAFICPDDPRFFHPDNMVDAVCGFLTDTGQPVPGDPPGLARVILESLALRYAAALTAIGEIVGRPPGGVHVIGGGSQNDFLNQATADATGLEVVAGPVEATAIGNILVQAIACGQFGNLAEARRFVAACHAPRCFEPRPSDAWHDARAHYRALEHAS